MSAPMTSFEHDLLHEMRALVSERGAAPISRRTRTRAVVAATVGAAVAAAGAMTLTGGSTAFAVATSNDGGVTIRIHELTAADDLEKALADRGIVADVDYLGRGDATTIDQDGHVSFDGPPPPSDPSLVPEDSRPLDSTFAAGRDSNAGPESSCGLTSAGTAPISLEREGGDYVITLAGPTLAHGNGLRLSTLTSQGHDSLVVSYAFGTSTCGAMVALP